MMNLYAKMANEFRTKPNEFNIELIGQLAKKILNEAFSEYFARCVYSRIAQVSMMLKKNFFTIPLKMGKLNC